MERRAARDLPHVVASLSTSLPSARKTNDMDSARQVEKASALRGLQHAMYECLVPMGSVKECGVCVRYCESTTVCAGLGRREG